MAEHSLTCRGCGAQFQASRRRAYCAPSCRPRLAGRLSCRCEGCGKSDAWYMGLCRDCSTRSKEIRRRQYDRDRDGAGRPPMLVGVRHSTRTKNVECKCLVCGCAFFPKAADRTKCCSRECGLAFTGMKNILRTTGGRVWARSPVRKKCSACGARFEGAGRYCSFKCRPSEYQKVTVGTCIRCGQSFDRGSNGASCYLCSDECRAASKAAAMRAKRALPSTIAYKKAAKKRRKALARGANGAENVSPERVFERDGWRCGICGKKTLPSKRGTCHPRAPELDHIVALALGGSHTYANVRCSCRACNGRKGAAALGQLPLFPRG